MVMMDMMAIIITRTSAFRRFNWIKIQIIKGYIILRQCIISDISTYY